MQKNTAATHGIAWMTFVIVLALAFTSPGFKTSFDQHGRNSFANMEVKNSQLEQSSSPVDAWNSNTIGPIQRALNEPRLAADPTSRNPSSLSGTLN